MAKPSKGHTMALVDEAERQRFLETLRTDDDFRATVRRELLTRALLDLPQTVSTLIEHQAEMQAPLTALAGDVNGLAGHVEVLARQQAELQRAVTSSSDMVGGARTDVRERLNEVEVTVAGLRPDRTNGLSSVAGGFTAMGGRFDQLDAAIAELRSGS